MKSTIQVKKKLLKQMPRRASLFWDVDPKKIDPDKNAVYVAERIMDFGYDCEAAWLWRAYPHSLLQSVVEKSRVLQPKTKALWRLLLQT